jgi:protein-S-isoprenylcysteine O-methyltransferase Ste14
MAPTDPEAPFADPATVIIFPPSLVAASSIFGVALWLLVPGPELPGAVSIAGAVLMAMGGIVIDRWAQSSLRRARTAVHPSHPTEAIVSTGAFASSRNPMSVAQGMLLAAMGFALRSPSFFAAQVPWIVVIRFGVAAREEQYLQRKFGDAHVAYRAPVRRWVWHMPRQESDLSVRREATGRLGLCEEHRNLCSFGWPWARICCPIPWPCHNHRLARLA